MGGLGNARGRLWLRMQQRMGGQGWTCPCPPEDEVQHSGSLVSGHCIGDWMFLELQ